jgi:hypothetical protein
MLRNRERKIQEKIEVFLPSDKTHRTWVTGQLGIFRLLRMLSCKVYAIDPRQQRAKMIMRCSATGWWRHVAPRGNGPWVKSWRWAAVKQIFRYWAALFDN